MSSRLNLNVTIYGEYVQEQVNKISKEGGAQMTFNEVASYMGLKPTHNLRKRLRTLEQLGLLDITMNNNGVCGTCLIYEIPTFSLKPLDNLDIPF